MAANKHIPGQGPGGGEKRRLLFRRPVLRSGAVVTSLICFGWLVWYAYGEGAALLNASKVPVLAPPENQKQKMESADAGAAAGKAGRKGDQRRVYGIMERPEDAAFESLVPSSVDKDGTKPTAEAVSKTDTKSATKADAQDIGKPDDKKKAAGDNARKGAKSRPQATDVASKDNGKVEARAGAGTGVGTGAGGAKSGKTAQFRESKKSGEPQKAEKIGKPEKTAKAGGKDKASVTGKAERHFVQLAALRPRSKAEAGARRLAKKHASVIRGTRVQVRRAVIPGVGEIFRVLLGPYPDRARARGICVALNKRQQDCFIASYQ